MVFWVWRAGALRATLVGVGSRSGDLPLGDFLDVAAGGQIWRA